MSAAAPAAPVTIVAKDAAPRGDLARRLELKYVLSGGDVGAVRQALLRYCTPIAHAGRVSVVRSLYFDDPSLSAARANLDGIGVRGKCRLRWYDAPVPDRSLFVECKWRRYRETGKHRLEVATVSPAGLSLDALPLVALRHGILRAAPDHPATQRLWNAAECVLLVEYRREHFALRGTGARLTLDYDLRFVPQLGRRRLDRRFSDRLPGLVLVEFKSGADELRHVPRVLAPLAVRQTRFSKYVAGCLRTGLLRES